MANKRWYRVVLPYAVFGIEATSDGLVTQSAPIGKWMVGKPLGVIMDWVENKGGKVKRIGDKDE